MRRAAGQDPTVYMAQSDWWTVIQAFRNAGVAEPHYWVAAWNGDRAIFDGAVAHQYADSAMAGGHYDLSSVVDFWPGVDSYGPPASAAGGGPIAQAPYQAATDQLAGAWSDFMNALGVDLPNTINSVGQSIANLRDHF